MIGESRRVAVRLLVIAGLIAPASAFAQDPPANVNGNDARNGPRNGKNEVAGPAYQDVLIDGGRLEPDVWTGDIAERDASGLPRGLRVDALYSNVKRAGFSETRYGLGVGAFLGTPLYGAWSFDGLFGNSREDNRSNGFLNSSDDVIATLWQRDMPFDGGWRASNGAGNLNSPSIDLVRFQPRWILPSSPMLGALTEWRNLGGTQLTAGVGEPGVFNGIYVPGFRRLGGTATTAGGQWALSPRWSSGLQYYGADDVTSPLQPELDAPRFTSHSMFAATAWQDANERYQLNVIGSDNSFNGTHYGGWGDGYVQTGRYGHGFGAFWLGSTLAWGNQLLGSDIRGAYYRLNYASRRWIWDAQIDYTDPVGESQFDTTTFVSANTRYQIWQDLAIGGGGNARTGGNTAWSAFAFVENTVPLLINRMQIYTARNAPKSEVTLTANQTWTVPAGTRLSTTVLVGRYDDRAESSNQFGLAIFGGGDIVSNLSLDANLQWTHSTGDAQPTTLIGNVGFTWRFRPDLQLIATFYRSQSQSQLPLQIVSPIAAINTPIEERISDRGAFLILRYEARAGSMAPPLGGMAGGGAGRVAGVVFLDSNEDGRFAAGEQGAANVTVILDGRYSTRTDGQGRYEFPAVAAGQHQIMVMPDNVPLPWMLLRDGRAEFEVPVRGNVNVDVGAQRMR